MYKRSDDSLTLFLELGSISDYLDNEMIITVVKHIFWTLVKYKEPRNISHNKNIFSMPYVKM